MLLQLYYYDHPVLRKRCARIESITDEIRKLAHDMVETMYEKDGVGLAAPQVGHSVRLFVMREYLEDEEGNSLFSEPKVYINPELTKPSSRQLIDTEGCLSIPGLRLKVARPASIVVTAQDLEGNTFTEEVSGYNARIRMHENDHLNGVLFIDRVSKEARQEIAPFLQECKQKFT